MAHQLQALPSLNAARSDVPDELEAIYRRMTARKAEQRFASMREVVDALNAIPAERLSRVAMPVQVRSNSDMSTTSPNDPSEAFASFVEPDPSLRATVVVSELDESSPMKETVRSVRNLLSTRRSQIVATVVASLLVVIGVVLSWPSSDDPPIPKKANNGNGAGDSRPIPPPKSLGFPASLEEVRQAQRDWAAFLKTEPIVTNSIGIKLSLIPPGEFQMGTSDSEFNRFQEFNVPDYELTQARSELPAHPVRLTKPFWMSQTEVTVRQFRRFVDAERFVTETERTAGFGIVNNQWTLAPGFSWQNVGEATVTDEHPASNLTWNDAVAFCDWLSRHESRELKKPVRYRLPTEAEWEYACRAGTASPWYFGNDVAAVRNHAIFANNSAGRLQPVGRKLENPFQLFDMMGNQAEWCQDVFRSYDNAEAIDPTGPLSGDQRVQRGGNFANQPFRLRSASRQMRLQNSPQDGCIRLVREE